MYIDKILKFLSRNTVFNKEINSIHFIFNSCYELPPVKYGGTERQICTLAEGLRDQGFKIVIYSPGELKLKNMLHMQSLKKPSPLWIEGNTANSLEHLENCYQLSLSNSKTGDILVFSNYEQSNYFRKRIRFHPISLLKFSRYLLYEIANCSYTGLKYNNIFPSKSIAEFNKTPGDVVYHGISKKYFTQPSMDKERTLLVYVGRIDNTKGIDLALEVAKKTNNTLTIAGPDAKTDFYKSIINHPNCNYVGELDENQVADLFTKSFAMLYFTQYTEPFGLAIAEALAGGCPVITSGNGATKELITEGFNGFICKDIESACLSLQKIKDIKEDDCIESAQPFTEQQMVNNYIKLFTKR